MAEIPFLNGDEARDAGLLPESFLRGEIRDFFGFGVYGIPNLFFALAAIPHFFFGHTILAIRFFSVVSGAAAVVLTYFLARKVLGGKVAVVAALILSTYQVHLQFSRSEFINNFDSFWAPLIILLLFLALESRASYLSLLLGLSVGLASHFYQGIRATLFFSSVYFLAYSLVHFRENIKNTLIKSSYFLFGIVLGLGPSLLVMARRPNEFFNTGTAGSPLFLTLGLSEFLRVLPERLMYSLGALIYYPIDFHYRYGGPFLAFPSSVFFLIGVLFILRNFSQREYHILFFWVFCVVVFNSALLGGINYAHRLLSLIPALIIIIALGIERLAGFLGTRTAIKSITVSFMLVILVFLDLKAYFWDNVWQMAYDANSRVAFMAGRYSAKLPTGTQIYFLNSPRLSWGGGSAWVYLASKQIVTDLSKEQLTQVLSQPLSEKLSVFIALPERESDLALVKTNWPRGREEKCVDRGELLFTIYELPKVN